MTQRIEPSPPITNYKTMENEDLYSFDAKEIERFLPSDFPRQLPDGRVPLRCQIFQDKSVLKNVLAKSKKGVFMCNHCDLSFTQFTSLLDHFDEFKIKRPHKCSHNDCCWKIVGFNRLRQLTRHESSIHNNISSFVCDKCSKKFGRIDLLNRHLKNVHENLCSRFNKKLAKQIKESHPSKTTTDSPTPTTLNTVSTTTTASLSPVSVTISEPEQEVASYKHSIDFLTSWRAIFPPT